MVKRYSMLLKNIYTKIFRNSCIVKLKIPVETQTGRMFRLKSKGVKSVRSHRQGDLMCKVVIETPVRLSKAQKALLKQFQETYETSKTDHNPKSSSWLDGVREFFDRMTS